MRRRRSRSDMVIEVLRTLRQHPDGMTKTRLGQTANINNAVADEIYDNLEEYELIERRNKGKYRQIILITQRGMYTLDAYKNFINTAYGAAQTAGWKEARDYGRQASEFVKV